MTQTYEQCIKMIYHCDSFFDTSHLFIQNQVGMPALNQCVQTSICTWSICFVTTKNCGAFDSSSIWNLKPPRPAIHTTHIASPIVFANSAFEPHLHRLRLHRHRGQQKRQDQELPTDEKHDSNESQAHIVKKRCNLKVIGKPSTLWILLKCLCSLHLDKERYLLISKLHLN